MKVTIRSKNLEVTSSLREYIQKKLITPVEKLLHGAEFPILDIEVSRTTRHHQKGKVYHVEVNLSLGKKMMRAEMDGEDPRSLCDIVREEIKGEVIHLHGKKESLNRKKARLIKNQTRFTKSASLNSL